MPCMTSDGAGSIGAFGTANIPTGCALNAQRSGDLRVLRTTLLETCQLTGAETHLVCLEAPLSADLIRKHVVLGALTWYRKVSPLYAACDVPGMLRAKLFEGEDRVEIKTAAEDPAWRLEQYVRWLESQEGSNDAGI